ncbi:MAG: PorV/PorQ family protein [bacterium]
MKKKTLVGLCGLIVSGLLISPSIHARAFSDDDAGTCGAEFLKLGVGARPIGMGEAFVAVADDASSISWNPAGLREVNRRQLAGMHAVWLEDFSYEYIAYAQPLKSGTLGASINYLHMGDIDSLDEQGNTTGSLSFHDLAVNVAYSSRISQLLWGINLKLIQEELAGSSAQAYATDIGVIYKMDDKDKLKLGAVVQNLGTEIKYESAGDPLPLLIKAGAAYRLKSNLLLAADINTPIDNDPSLHLGIEYKFNKLKNIDLAARAGYKTTTIVDLDALSGLSAGLGCKISDIGIDYAWIQYGDLGNTHRISFLVSF